MNGSVLQDTYVSIGVSSGKEYGGPHIRTQIVNVRGLVNAVVPKTGLNRSSCILVLLIPSKIWGRMVSCYYTRPGYLILSRCSQHFIV